MGLDDGFSKIIGRNQHIAFVRKLMKMTLPHTLIHFSLKVSIQTNKHFFEPTQIDSQNLGLADGFSKIIGRNQHIAFVRKLMEMTLLHTLKIYENFVQSFS